MKMRLCPLPRLIHGRIEGDVISRISKTRGFKMDPSKEELEVVDAAVSDFEAALRKEIHDSLQLIMEKHGISKSRSVAVASKATIICGLLFCSDQHTENNNPQLEQAFRQWAEERANEVMAESLDKLDSLAGGESRITVT